MSFRLAVPVVALLLGCAPAAVPGGPFGTPDATADAPTIDAPADAGPTDDLALGVDVPAIDAPLTDVPVTDVPVTDAPVADAPVTVTDTPTTDTPATDVPATGCTRDAQCTAPRAVCDRARGLCVECSTATACATGLTCASGRCVPPTTCASSRMCPGQVCDPAAGRCVDCLAATDCPSGELCRANLCVPPPRTCRSSRECSELDQVCHPTDGVCVDCAGDNDCVGGYCTTDRTCRPRACTPDERACVDATRVRVCDARGTAATETPCAAGETCSGGRCLPRVCSPGAADCAADGSRRVCNPDGLGSTTTACTGGLICAGGECQAGCGGGLLRCGTACVDARNDAANCGACGVRCGAGEACAAAREGCTAACVPATTATPIGGTPLTVRLPAALAARATDASATGRGVAGEEAATGVAWVIGRTGPVTSADLAEAVVRVESPITQATTARSLLAGERVRLADGEEAIHERIVTSCSSATALRDRVALALALPTAGATVGVGAECVAEFAVTRRASGEVIVALAVASRADWGAAEATARRLRDLAVFGLPQSTATPAAVCASLTAAATAPVDVLWLQDTSASLAAYQTRVGRAAPSFVDTLASAGVSMRVTVLQANATPHNLDAPGLTWVGGSAPLAAYYLCDRLTSPSQATCPLMATGFSDIAGPYSSPTGSVTGEEPIAGAITNFTTLLNRAAAGETNADRRVRAGARRVTIGLTDEPGTNDFNRYFMAGTAPDTMAAWGATWSATTMANIAAWFTRNQVLPLGLYPHTVARCGANVNDLPRCVASAAGGAYADLNTTTDADTQATLAGFAVTIAAEVSTLRLASVPVGGIARVTVRGTEVPRSSVDGYEIDPARRALVFRGTRYRPAAGDAVTVTYPAW